jgi:hypothetical protein
LRGVVLKDERKMAVANKESGEEITKEKKKARRKRGDQR